MPAHIKGVLNLHGKIVPVIDLRMRFGLPVISDTDQTCMIVVKTESANGTSLQIGLIVDAVEEVVNISAEEIESSPDFGTTLDTSFILGMAKVKDKVKTLLDIDRVLGQEVYTV